MSAARVRRAFGLAIDLGGLAALVAMFRHLG